MAAQVTTLDLRSDTVTKPTARMREAAATAEVGDDVLGDDPTVAALERAAAARFGKAAGLFVTSGTQGNLCAVMAHCRERGSELVLGDRSHIHIYEQGGVATVAGVHPRTVPNAADGSISPADVDAAVRPADAHFPVTALVCVENTHNRCGGAALPPDFIDEIGALCAARGLPLHLDGARVANACVKFGVSAERMCRAATTVSVCLSKGLGAPAGSVLVGPPDVIARARRARKVLGGGLRQAGVLAAPARVALDEMWDRLADDHDVAAALGDKLAGIAGDRFHVVLPDSMTNMLYVGVAGSVPAAAIVEGLARRGVRVLAVDGATIRAVANHHVQAGEVSRIARGFCEAYEEAQEAMAAAAVDSAPPLGNS